MMVTDSRMVAIEMGKNVEYWAHFEADRMNDGLDMGVEKKTYGD